MDSHNSALGTKKFVYFPLDKEGQEQMQQSRGERELPRDVLDKLLKALGREALREKTPSLQELEQTLQGIMSQQEQQEQESKQQLSSQPESNGNIGDDSGMPLVRQLINKGYLKESPKWLSKILSLLMPSCFALSVNCFCSSFTFSIVSLTACLNPGNLVNCDS